MTEWDARMRERDIKEVASVIQNWNLAAVPLTAVLGLLIARIISPLIAEDTELLQGAMKVLIKVLPIDDFGTRMNVILIIVFSAMLLVAIFLAKLVVSAIITQRLVAHINRSSHPMLLVGEMRTQLANVNDGAMRERFYFRPTHGLNDQVQGEHAGHRGSILWPFILAIAICLAYVTWLR